MTIPFPRLRHAAAPVEPPVEIPRRPRPKDRTIARLLGLLPPVRNHRLKALEESRLHLPVTDPDRFLLYMPDPSFEAMAIENPDLVTNDPTWKPGVTS